MCCRDCAVRKYDAVSYWLVYIPTGAVASPRYATVQEVRQFANFLNIQPKHDYNIHETLLFYDHDHPIDTQWFHEMIQLSS